MKKKDGSTACNVIIILYYKIEMICISLKFDGEIINEVYNDEFL